MNIEKNKNTETYTEVKMVAGLVSASSVALAGMLYIIYSIMESV